MCNIDSKNETEEGYPVLPGTTPTMMVYWTMLSLFLFLFVFPLVVLFLDSVFSVRALWSLSLFFSVPVPVLFASLSTCFFFPWFASLMFSIISCFTQMIFYLFPSLQQKDKYLVCDANYANHDGMKAVKRYPGSTGR
ncbi:hypothetical protein NC651_004457 [Populus alba x Populus x berolinensis]|nr:hypothetical protein NC651_004457 [Populus alba x Populus x berolinensis]